MLNDSSHDQLSDTTTAMFWHDKDIRDMCDGSKICNDPGKADLSPIEKRTEAKRMLNRPLNDSSRNALCPIRGKAQEIVNQCNIQTIAVGGNLVMIRCWHKSARYNA